MYRATFLLLLLERVASHGAVTSPPPRNAIDGKLAPWNGTLPGAMPFMFWCTHPMNGAADVRNVTGRNGQACFWFNNGCDISCDECDGRTGQVIHPHFINDSPDTFPSWAGEHLRMDPSHNPVDKGGRPDGSSRLSICENPKHRPTVCDPKLRTLNVNAECGSADDVYQFAPWRKPGAAPMIDSCGVAGGVLPGQPAAADGGDFQNNSLARRADRGSKLPPAPSGTVWTAGEVVEVAWTRKAWHGGGYQYRLCPSDAALDEKCFQATPVPFADGTSTLRWGGVGGRAHRFNATDVSVGTLPAGSTWRRSPLPRGPWDWQTYGPSPLPVCDETAACKAAEQHPTPTGHSPQEGAAPCECSGSGVGDLYTLEVVDALRLPASLAPGEWVLGWRWDCEESTQVWASCSDVTIRAPLVEA